MCPSGGRRYSSSPRNGSSVKSLPPDAVVIVAPALDVVNVKVASNSSPEAKLENSVLKDVNDNVEVLLVVSGNNLSN